MNDYIAIDQYGYIEYNLGPYPRKELLTRWQRKHADKIYVGTKSKGQLHIGWVIAGRWFTVYHIQRMEKG